MLNSPPVAIGAQYAGQRLDQTLRAIFPFLGLRGARRALNTGQVLLNGKRPLPGTRVKTGDRLDFCPPTGTFAAKVKLLKTSGPYAFLHKPAKMHCARLPGGDNPSLEEMFELLSPEPLQLLQRLDYGTSGIVLASADMEAISRYQLAQEAGAAKKYYLALLRGELPGEMTINNELDVSRRRKTRVLPAPGTRKTILSPLRLLQWPNSNIAAGLGQAGNRATATLTLCAITRGARHQIRAHAAHAGFPLFGDSLYDPAESGDNFFLHQTLLAFNGHSCINLPQWLPEDCEELALKTLQDKFG